MISSIFELCQNVNIELNLLDLIKGLSTLTLITAIVLVVKKVRLILKKEREVDKRIRETRASIIRHIIEIGAHSELIEPNLKEEYGVPIPLPLEEVRVLRLDESTLNKSTSVPVVIETPEEGPDISVSLGIPKGKKTRAMSMEERWAEFDKKRAMRSTA